MLVSMFKKLFQKKEEEVKLTTIRPWESGLTQDEVYLNPHHVANTKKVWVTRYPHLIQMKEAFRGEDVTGEVKLPSDALPFGVDIEYVFATNKWVAMSDGVVVEEANDACSLCKKYNKVCELDLFPEMNMDCTPFSRADIPF